MTKDIDSIKKVLLAIAKDLRSLDGRLREIECNCDTIDVALEKKSINSTVFHISEKDGTLIEDEINELFELIDSTNDYE